MDELQKIFNQIFNLQDPTGKTIVYWIRVFFWVGVINYGVHLVRLGYEYICLKFVQIKIKKGLDVTSPDLRNRLAKSIVIRTGISVSIIYRRIHDLVKIKQNGGEIDHDVLGDIHAGAAGRKAGLSNYILGILIILGLVGTLWGLTTAVIEVQPLLQDIDDLDQLPQISRALQETLKGMGTAFKTTLAGLVTSLGLGALGWLFSLSNSAFLTRFETVVATEVTPHFKETPESLVESSLDQLQISVGEFKLATEDNVRRMQASIQQLTEKSWDAYLEQQYVIANELREIPGELRESLGGISEYQVLIKSTLESFEKLTENFMTEISKHQSTVDTLANDFKELTTHSMSQISEYQEALREGLESAVPQLEAESEALKTTIRGAQNSQAEFIENLADILKGRLQSIMDRQQDMVTGLRETVVNMREIADELQIRSALDRQNEVFEDIKSELILNQQEMGQRLSQLISKLQIIPALEAQNKVFGRIENHLEGQRDLFDEQKRLMETLDSSVNRLQQTFSNAVSGEQERTERMLQQLTLNFVVISEKMDTLNHTMSKPGLYRWGSEVRRWFGIFRKWVKGQ